VIGVDGGPGDVNVPESSGDGGRGRAWGWVVGSEVVEVALPNGAVAWVQARQLDGGGATKTGVGRFDFGEVSQTLEGVSEAIKGAVVKAAPSKVSVKLGLELAVKSGALVGLLVDGQTKGSLEVTLEWTHSPAPSSTTPPSATAAAVPAASVPAAGPGSASAGSATPAP
jgi:hypothetical protein